MLCALDLDEPCGTFRENRPEGLVPPRQPVLLLRPPRWAPHDPDVGAGVPVRPVPVPLPEPDFNPEPEPVFTAANRPVTTPP